MGTRRGISDRSLIGMGAPARPEGSSPGILRDHRNRIGQGDDQVGVERRCQCSADRPLIGCSLS